jgi:hypothetical protein
MARAVRHEPSTVCAPPGRQRMTGAPTPLADREPTVSPRQLRRRRAASWRSPILESGHADPWHYEPLTAGYESAAAHLLGFGLLPAPNHEGLRLMWHRGGHTRQAAELIAERWELSS